MVNLTPYIAVHDAEAAIQFYQKAFGAVESNRFKDNNGKIAFTELHISNAKLFISDEYPDIDVHSPQSLGGTSVSIFLDIDDADIWAKRAIDAGITVVRPVSDQQGMRSGLFKCPFGHRWFISSTK